ncbi:MAG: family 10 glycosylhydrolase [Saprospiraceae bacterium]|nr:family 10 glycosylhydrolase [Saprospiraceae bacterium]
MKKQITLLFAWVILSSTSLLAQTPPKREFRAAWVATVSNIDWPSSKNLSVAAQKQEFVTILDKHKQAGLNAVFVQVRGYCDAIYPSLFEPWSDVLTGLQGRSPQYDPLDFMISECRKRGMEFHAWFNPYRVLANINTAIVDSNHVSRKRPEWLLAYGNARILDPGLPEVRNYVTSVVLDVVKRYDIDGVHFDDYFYPYPQTGLVLNDDSTYIRYNRGFVNRDNWRRDNVDLFVKMISDTLKAVKPWVKFGISPFGIWQNRSSTQPLGSATNGLQSYSDIFADSRKWMQQGWLDYAAPQLYWYIGFSAANYSVLVPWWNDVAFGKHVYIGQGAYRINADANWNAAQMPTQIRLNRQYANVFGSIYYNTTSLKSNVLGFADSLAADLYKYPALLPTMKWRDSIPPSVPTNLVATRNPTNVQLAWTKPTATTQELNRVRQFVIYRFDDYTPINLSDARFIRYITPTDTTAFTDDKVQTGRRYTYIVTSLDRFQNESEASNSVTIIGTSSKDFVTETLSLDVSPNPFSASVLIEYELKKSSFVTLSIHDLYGREVALLNKEFKNAGLQTQFFTAEHLPTGVYFVRLKTDFGTKTRKAVLQK